MTTFRWTACQELAFVMMRKFMDPQIRSPMPAVLTGYAGTGKTTLIKALASEFGEPVLLAPTGKAALRVEEAAGLKASTIHRWLYHPKENPLTGEIGFTRRTMGEVRIPSNGLVIIDEASMVGRDLWEDLWDMVQMIPAKVLLVGDPFQLPPVESKFGADRSSFQALANVETPFRAHLEEVTRQALDNPILRAAMEVRESGHMDKWVPLLKRVYSRNVLDECLGVHSRGGVILAHTNKTRHAINTKVRAKLGITGKPVGCEPLLVLRNDYELDVFNGEVIQMMGWNRQPEPPRIIQDIYKRDVTASVSFGLATVEIHQDGRPPSQVTVSPEQVAGECSELSDASISKHSRLWAESAIGNVYREDENGRSVYAGPRHLHCNFGYALTCHKAQGSEWDETLVCIEKTVRPTTYEGRRWVYTALTRAKKACSIYIGI